jgi:hypothetical protein
MTTWAGVTARRMRRHGLVPPYAAGTSLADVAGTICGAHAQVLSAGEVSLALRVDGATRADVRRALWDERSLVKTFGPRGTVHLLTTRDLARWCAALSEVPRHSPFADGVRLEPEQLDQVVDAIGRALADAELTTDELDEALVADLGPWVGERVMPAFQDLWPRWRQAVGVAAHRGVLCFGPDRGRRVTYTNPQRFLDLAPVPGAEAAEWLAHGYQHAYGPATAESFARWLAAPAAWAGEVFDRAGLGELEVEGEVVRANPDDDWTEDVSPGGVHLLPYFDAFVVGSQPRDRLYPGRAATRALAPSGQAGNHPVLLVDGVVAGVWHQKVSGRRVTVTVEPLGTLTRAQHRQLEERVERLGEIHGARAELVVGEVTVGPHA